MVTAVVFETRSGSEIQHMVTLGNTGFFQQRTNCLAHHCTKPIYVGRRAPRPSGMLEASHFLRVEVMLGHEWAPFIAAAHTTERG